LGHPAKQWHGLGRAWRRGLSKMRVQCLLIAAVINFKRLATAFCNYGRIKLAFYAVLEVLSLNLGTLSSGNDIYYHSATN